jgi:hypothetical protein
MTKPSVDNGTVTSAPTFHPGTLERRGGWNATNGFEIEGRVVDVANPPEADVRVSPEDRINLIARG